MRIEQRESGGVVILDLYGRFVVEDGVPAFVEKMNALSRQGRKRVVLNFEGVTYLDSAGVGAVAWKFVTARKQNGDVKLLNLRPRSFKVLDTTKLLTVIATFDSEADAVQSFDVDTGEEDVDPIFT
jgi:anti-sigma B factor antagonist